MSLRAIARSTIARRVYAAAMVLAMSLKILIPAGFMLASLNGHTSLVLCPAGIHLAHDMPDAMAMVMGDPHAMPMHHSPGTAQHAHAAASADQCPYAQAAGGALHPHAFEVAAPYFALLRPVTATETGSVPLAPPIRHRAPRGPPSLA